MKNLRLLALLVAGFATMNLSVRAEEAATEDTKVIEVAEDATLVVANTKEVTVEEIDGATVVVIEDAQEVEASVEATTEADNA